MIDERELLERAIGRFPPEPGILERVYRRRDRQARTRRVATLIVTLVLVAIVFGAMLRAFEKVGPNMPAGPITPSNVGALGLAWTAGLGDNPSTLMPYPNLPRLAGVYQPPAVGDGNVYVGTRDGTLEAFDVACGGPCRPRWTATLDSGIVDGPTVADHMVFATTEAGRLYAFSANCSREDGRCSPEWRGDIGARAYSAPVVADGKVYVHTVAEQMFAFDETCSRGGATCAPVWSRRLLAGPIDRCAVNSNETPDHECDIRTPVVADGTVYVVATEGSIQQREWRESIVALDGSTGDLRWSFEAPPYECCTVAIEDPAVAGGRVFVRLADQLYAFSVDCTDPCTPLWRGFASQPPVWTSSPVVYRGDVFVGATENFPGNAGPIGWVFAFPTDCGTDGSVCHPRWIGRSRDELTGVVPEVFDGRLLVTSILGGFVDAFDADCAPTGRRCARAWSTGFSIAPQLPVGADGVVYVAEGNGSLSAFDASCQGEACKRLWTWTDPKAAELSPPTIVGDNVFVSTSDGRLLAFSLGAGRRSRAGATLPFLYVAVLVGVIAAVAVGRRLSRRSSVRSSSERP